MHDKWDRIGRLLQEGNATSAEKMAMHCTQYFPEIAENWFLLGAALHFQQKRDAALSTFNRALALQPGHIQALRAKATVLSELGRLNESLETCRQALKLAPNDADLAANLGTALEKIGRLEEALEQFDFSLAQNPRHPIALLNRGALLIRMQKLEEAITHNQRFIDLYPEIPDAYYNLSETLSTLHRHEEGLQACEAGIAIAPRYAPLHLNRGVALAVLRRFEESQTALAHAQILDPSLLAKLIPEIDQLPVMVDAYASTEMMYLEANIKAMQDCYWEGLQEFLDTLAQFIEKGTPSGLALHDIALAFTLPSLSVSPEVRLRIMRQISEYVQDRSWLSSMPPFRHVRGIREKIRIGYVSPDFRDHPVGHLTRQLYGLHDRQRFEIHGYALRLEENDPTQQTIASSCDYWHDLSCLDNSAAARKIYEDGIDILIDLAGYTQYSRPELFALRPAPVQAHYLGYPGTMGADFIDYAILDETVCPSGSERYLAESPVLLPGTYCPYDPTTPNRPTRFSRADFGLPEQGFVFCCFSASYKIEPTIFAAWLRLLHQRPDSVLWFTSRQTMDIANLRREALNQGIDPSRLISAPHISRSDHLQRFQLADLFLDTRWHNAHTMAADALWQGLPVLTCAGEHWSSRLAASLLTALDIPELITSSLEEYEAKATAFASYPDKLAALKNKLARVRHTSTLFSPRTTVRSLEHAYQAMWEKWLAGDRPTKILVPSNTEDL